MKIAIIGSGISGLGSAYILNSHHDITLYEKNDYIGGHARTIKINDGNLDINVDTGFIVFNDRNYPLLTSLFKRLQIPSVKSSMSFGVKINNGWLEYGTESLSNLFGQKRNLFRVEYWKMLLDILKFNKRAAEYLDKDVSISLKDCIKELALGEWFQKYYLLAMGGAIWSSTPKQMLSFPAKSFIRFFDNHGLLSVNDQPQWYSVNGGSKEYISRITRNFRDKIKLSTGVTKVIRKDGKITIIDSNNESQEFDQVIFACHSDQALKMLDQPSDAELDIIGSFKYQKNTVVTHSDINFMPKRKSCWASWVYLSDDSNPISENMALTYWMNNLQNLPSKKPILVTMNPTKMPDANLTYDIQEFEHPIFDKDAIIAQDKVTNIQGQNNTWYCGAYLRNGFHEDGLWSAVEMTKQMGIVKNWD